MGILQEIAVRTKERIALLKQTLSLEAVIEAAAVYPVDKTFAFEQALRTDDIAFICEIKKASPSKGVIAEEFDYLKIALDYETAGAQAISVLTEPHYFLGSDHYLKKIAGVVKTPILRKDFVVDSYMIYQTKLLGASAVLLICSLLNIKTLAEYIAIANSLGLSALVEAHDEAEVQMALSAGARVIGVNNRDLETFEVDISTSENLRQLVPADVLFVAESGIHTPEDIDRLRELGADAVLIGESIMRSVDKKAEIDRLRGYQQGARQW
ncbi:MAG: indole-3-glycerol phosphate synthase TrpC [Coriobacteriales bacterium]|nr:indole-3-glycerol phosphate synthase TrpC [Coriobacteriales bacterium]